MNKDFNCEIWPSLRVHTESSSKYRKRNRKMALTYVDMSSVIEIQVNSLSWRLSLARSCQRSFVWRHDDNHHYTTFCWWQKKKTAKREKQNVIISPSIEAVSRIIFDSFMFCILEYQERLTSHGGGLGLTSSSPAYTGHSASSGGRSSLSSSQSMHQPADFQPPYFPPPFHHPSTHQSPPQQQQQVNIPS